MFFSNPTKDPDLNKISQAKNQNIPGIPEKDLLAFEKYADDEDVILLFRPVEPLTKTLHTDGKYPTKNFKIKGKSSSWGLWAGFIPMDQYYSKLNGASNEVIENANKEVQDCIQKQHAQSVHLKISKKRFQELKEKEIIFPQKQKEGKYLVIYCPRPHNDGTLELCYAQEVNTVSGTEYAIYTAEKNPFYVLADTFLKRPLIADYDLLAIFSPWKNYGSDSKRLNPDITHKERCRKLSPREQRRSIESAEKFYAREDPNLGNIAPETVKNIKGLNKVLNKGNYLECIHHNDDAGSWVSNPSANYPVTVIIPPIEAANSTRLLIETTEKFVDFINKINAIGYYRVTVNPLWELPIKWAAIRNYFFYKVQLAYCKDKNPENMHRTLMEMFKSIDLSDTTFTKELSNLFKIMTKINFDSDEILFKKFFDIIQSSLFVNSTLVVKLCCSLETLLNNEALSEKNIDRLLALNKILRKDIRGFYEILNILNILPIKDAKIIDNYLKLVESHIYDNKLDRIEFETKLEKFISILEPKVTNTKIFRP